MNLLDNLATPIPYLIQKNTDFSALDTFGWSLMHYAVAINNINKTSELLLCEIDFKHNSSTNNIPTNLLVCKGKDDVDMYENIPHIKIPYCENGYTPVHLSVFLNKYYQNRNHPDYRFLASTQEEMFKKFLITFKDVMYWEDSNNLTVTDYSVLSLNVNYLKKIKALDNDLVSLQGVHPITAKKIFENEVHRNTTHKDQNLTTDEINFMKELIIFFDAKHRKDTLENNLSHKKEEKSGRIKI